MTYINLDNYFRNLLICCDCGAKPDYSNLPHSLSDVWVVEGECATQDYDWLICTCTDCAVFYQQSQAYRVHALLLYTQADLARLDDLVFPDQIHHGNFGNRRIAIIRCVRAMEDATYFQRKAAAKEKRTTPRMVRPSRSRASDRPIPLGLRYSILQRDGFRCQTCGRSPAVHGVVLHVDHIMPRSKGGTNDPANLRALCAECNWGKADR